MKSCPCLLAWKQGPIFSKILKSVITIIVNIQCLSGKLDRWVVISDWDFLFTHFQLNTAGLKYAKIHFHVLVDTTRMHIHRLFHDKTTRTQSLHPVTHLFLWLWNDFFGRPLQKRQDNEVWLTDTHLEKDDKHQSQVFNKGLLGWLQETFQCTGLNILLWARNTLPTTHSHYPFFSHSLWAELVWVICLQTPHYWTL